MRPSANSPHNMPAETNRLHMSGRSRVWVLAAHLAERARATWGLRTVSSTASSSSYSA
jgi:hypothetical protein